MVHVPTHHTIHTTAITSITNSLACCHPGTSSAPLGCQTATSGTMRIQDVLKLLVCLVFFAALPTGSAQRGRACTTNDQCDVGKCCAVDGKCSKKDIGTVTAGAKAADICECASQTYDQPTGRCGCRDDTDCASARCCTVEGICSKRDSSSVLPGRPAQAACECVSGAYSAFTGKCMCSSSQQHCLDDTCCRASNHCSSRPGASVFGNSGAADACECKSGEYDGALRKCLCRDDSHCGDKCCVEDNRCSWRGKGSLRAGRRPGNVCECASKIIIESTGRCGCTETSHCLGTRGEICKDNVCWLQGKPVDNETCTEDVHCDMEGFEHCPELLCVLDANALAIGDPHMTGFLGQKFDFTGRDGAWYALVSEPPSMQLNMRVTVPVPSVPETTYITGFSLITTDADGLDHSIVVTVKEPHNVESACPVGVSPCLADGSLTVLLDGEEALAAPGTVSLAPGVEVTAVNTPGECRSFGFEMYWAKKKKANAAYWAKKEQENTQDQRKLSAMQDMGQWILANPTATNMADCADYVARSAVVADGLFAHQSEYASFRIVTPAADIRLSHGRRHEVGKRGPTDTVDLPDHVAWQMNIAVDHSDFTRDAKGILGETLSPTHDADGNMITHGVGCIRGVQEDYAVDGPLGKAFTMNNIPALQGTTAGDFS